MSNCKVMLSQDGKILECKIAKNFFDKLFGIMFKHSFDYHALLFYDAYWMHSFFCLVTFHIVFLDENFNVIETFYNVKPNKILPPVWEAKYAIEFFDDTFSFKKGQKLFVEGL